MTQFNIDDSAFFSRIREVVAVIGNQSKAAEQIGVTVSSVARWIKGESDPSRTNLVRLAQAAGVSVQWLATGEGERNQVNPVPQQGQDHIAPVVDTVGNSVNINDFVFIPYYDVNASAGHGAWTDSEPQKTTLAFRREWLATFVTRHFEQLSVVSVQGDSMSGVLEDGDTILINHTQTEPRDGLYALRIGNDVFVKRIQRFPDHLLIKSANPEYAPFKISTTEDNDQNIAIIGKVVWLGRKI